MSHLKESLEITIRRSSGSALQLAVKKQSSMLWKGPHGKEG